MFLSCIMYNTMVQIVIGYWTLSNKKYYLFYTTLENPQNWLIAFSIINNRNRNLKLNVRIALILNPITMKNQNTTTQGLNFIAIMVYNFFPDASGVFTCFWLFSGNCIFATVKCPNNTVMRYRRTRSSGCA